MRIGVSELLTYAVKDAEGVEKVLRDGFQFDEIITLYNEQATRDKIMQALYGFRSLTPDGGVFVYFCRARNYDSQHASWKRSGLSCSIRRLTQLIRNVQKHLYAAG